MININLCKIYEKHIENVITDIPIKEIAEEYQKFFVNNYIKIAIVCQHFKQ